jgi:hypothetical protein
MMQHTDIIPVRIGCQTMSDGADALWHKISNQLIIMGTINQDEASSIKKSANGRNQRTQISPEKSKLGKHHSFKPTPTPEIPIVRTR